MLVLKKLIYNACLIIRILLYEFAIGIALMFKFTRESVDKIKAAADHAQRELEQLWPAKPINLPQTFDHDVYTEDSGIDLSIIVPLYNAATFIPGLMKSIASQTSDYNVEYIFIDDGSRDNTFELISEYETRIRNLTIVKQCNRGISIARNEGISRSKGKYLCFIDQDDQICPEFTQLLLETALSNDADIVKCGYEETRNGKVLDVKCNTSMRFSGRDIESAYYSGFVWGAVIKRDMFASIRFPEDYWYEDMIMSKILVRMSKLTINLPDALYIKTYHERNSASIVWSNKNLRCLEQLYLVELLIEVNNNMEMPRDFIFFRSFLYDMTTVMISRTDGISKEHMRKILTVLRSIVAEYYSETYRDRLSHTERRYVKAIQKNSLWCYLSIYKVELLKSRFQKE